VGSFALDIVLGSELRDIKNPNSQEELEHRPPEQLADDILKKEKRIAELMHEIKQALTAKV
jgi:type I restriction enzyme M protein